MAAIPQAERTTVNAIYEALTVRATEEARPHLGASILGRPCRRELWYRFRWCVEQRHGGRMLRLFRRGVLEEAQFVADLRAAGVTVSDRDARGQQWQFSDVGGHVGGSMDAAVLGLVEAPKTWHVAEFKTHGAKSFAALQKDGVQKSKPEHWAQVQLYMHWSGMERAYYLAVCKDDDTLYGERIHYDNPAALALLDKAHAVVTAAEPLERLSEKPEFYACKFCVARPACHGGRVPPVSCRNCVHATAELDGKARWSCARHRRDLTVEAQRAACDDHVYIPALPPWEFVGGDEAANCAEYRAGERVLRNGTPGPGVHASRELFAVQRNLDLLSDPLVKQLRDRFDGRVKAVERRDEPPMDDIELLRERLPL